MNSNEWNLKKIHTVKKKDLPENSRQETDENRNKETSYDGNRLSEEEKLLAMAYLLW